MLPLGLPFAEVAVSTEWSNWPSLPDLFPKSFPGVKTSRDSFVVDIDFGSGDAVMPGQGRAAARPYTSHECETLPSYLSARFARLMSFTHELRSTSVRSAASCPCVQRRNALARWYFEKVLLPISFVKMSIIGRAGC